MMYLKALSLAAITGSAIAASPRYSVYELYDPSFTLNRTRAVDVNDSGVVVGNELSFSQNTLARTWKWTPTEGASRITEDTTTGALAVYESGAVLLGESAGFRILHPDGSVERRWAPGRLSDGFRPAAARVSPGGHVVSMFEYTDRINAGTRGIAWWPYGGYMVLETGLPGYIPNQYGQVTELYGVNGRGQFVGYASGPGSDSAVIWTPPEAPLLVRSRVRLVAINESSVAIGFDQSNHLAMFAVRWTEAGGIEPLPLSPEGWVPAESTDINDAGVAIGDRFTSRSTQPWIFDPAIGTRRLIPLIDGTASGYLFDQSLVAINNHGWIVGSATKTSNFVEVEVLLRPPCNAADLASLFGTLDVDDVVTFLNAFGSGSMLADIAEPEGVLDIDDVLTFLGVFSAGCP